MTDVSEPSAARHRRLLGTACALAVVALFASFTLMSRLGYASSLRIGELAAIRFSVGGLLLLPLLLRHGLAGLSLRRAALLAALGGLGFALLAYSGFYLAPAAHGATLLHGTLPLFSIALGWLWARAHPGRRRLAGLGIICIGLALTVADSLLLASAAQLLGDAALLMASACWASYGLLLQRWRVAPAAAAAIVATFSAAAYLPVWLAFATPGTWPTPGPELWRQVVFQGVLLGAASIFIYSKAVSLLGADQTALWTAAVPGVTTLTAIPLLAEHPSGLALAGVAIAMLGMAACFSQRAAPAQREPGRWPIRSPAPAGRRPRTSGHRRKR